MTELSIQPGVNCTEGHYLKDIKRVKCAEKRFVSNTLEARRAKRLKKLNLESKLSNEEGVTYEAGGF